jgi:tRNA threonylcarbamoyladenosine biosynthesis protein TsaE
MLTREITQSNIDLYQLESIANKIASNIKVGDIITLTGDLGVGKTTFCRFLINALTDNSVKVTSPTFNILNIYSTKKYNIWHYDLYRLKNESELFELGFEDEINDVISIIEWPDIAKNFLPKKTIDITMLFAENGLERNIIIKNTTI